MSYPAQRPIAVRDGLFEPRTAHPRGRVEGEEPNRRRQVTPCLLWSNCAPLESASGSRTPQEDGHPSVGLGSGSTTVDRRMRLYPRYSGLPGVEVPRWVGVEERHEAWRTRLLKQALMYLYPLVDPS